MSTMNTYTGRKMDPMQMTPEDVCIEDIAHALSLLCRGGGHIVWFHSVAQHCINCAKEAKARGWSDRMAFICLMHDASEAYISDIIRPVKGHLTNYMAIEQMIMQVILDRFGLSDMTEEEDRRWRQIDDEILDYELKVMMVGEVDRILVKLASTPDFAEKEWRDVEKEFLQLAQLYQL